MGDDPGAVTGNAGPPQRAILDCPLHVYILRSGPLAWRGILLPAPRSVPGAVAPENGESMADPHSFRATLRSAYEAHLRKEYAEAGEPVDRTEWDTPAQIVNAYYNRLANEIVFSADIWQPSPPSSPRLQLRRQRVRHRP